jgi:hypothetical protein
MQSQILAAVLPEDMAGSLGYISLDAGGSGKFVEACELEFKSGDYNHRPSINR